jgi:CBS domain containing-hemolysin-like protein
MVKSSLNPLTIPEVSLHDVLFARFQQHAEQTALVSDDV